MNPSRQRPGFSLAETLIALVIFMLAIGVLGSAANSALTSINTLTINEGQQRDLTFVRDQVLTVTDTDTLSTGGSAPTPNAGLATWTADYTPTQIADLFVVNITISLPGDGDTPAQTVPETLYLLRTPWSQTQDRSTLLQSAHDNLQKYRQSQQWP
jgi:hypothetical protein